MKDIGTVSVGNVTYSLGFRFGSTFRRVTDSLLGLVAPQQPLAIEFPHGPEIVEVDVDTSPSTPSTSSGTTSTPRKRKSDGNTMGRSKKNLTPESSQGGTKKTAATASNGNIFSRIA